MEIEFDVNWCRFALHVSIEKWRAGWAWAIEIGPFSVQGTPKN